MKLLMILLSSFVLSASAFAEDQGKTKSIEDSETEGRPFAPGDSPEDKLSEAVSVKGAIGCKDGFCPNPIDGHQAGLTDKKRAKELVDWIMNNGTGKPPSLVEATK